MADSHRPLEDVDPLVGPYVDPESRRLTPSIGLTPGAPQTIAPQGDEPPLDEAANEDFLFHLYRGSELLHDNRIHEAKEELERALHLQPRDTQGQDLIAVVYFRLGMYPRAIAIFEQLRKRNPRDTALLLNVALCYLKTGQPAQARAALEQLLEINPGHTRAWGYLGLACERTGDLTVAEHAFRQGGHDQMARRIAERRGQSIAPVEGPAASERGSAAVDAEARPRDVVATAFKELDAGDLSFGLAEPAADSPREAPGSWRSIELGRALSTSRRDTQKPDTKDGPPRIGVLAVPQLAAPRVTRMPTLLAAPPSAGERDIGVPGFDRIPSPKPPSYSLDAIGVPSLRHPVVAVPPVRDATRAVHDPPPAPQQHTKTLPPPGPPLAAPSAPPPAAGELTAQSSADFPAERGVVLHASGVALVRTVIALDDAQAANAGAPPGGFAARLEAIRAHSNSLSIKLLEKQTKGKPSGESFGGVGSPVVHASGAGQLVLGPRAGRKLSSFVLADDMCFVREEVLLGFDGELAYENGRLATGEGDLLAIVQLRGTGAVLLEAIGEVLTLDVKANRGISVRREVILGWFGRLVPRALAPSEAPCGQRGLISFAGEGRVLVASA